MFRLLWCISFRLLRNLFLGYCADTRAASMQLAAHLGVRLLNLVLQRSGPQRPDADDAQDDQR